LAKKYSTFLTKNIPDYGTPINHAHLQGTYVGKE
jgi:hypothetical protein